MSPRNTLKGQYLHPKETHRGTSDKIKACLSPLNSTSHTVSGILSSMMTKGAVGYPTNSPAKTTTLTSQTLKSLIEVSGDPLMTEAVPMKMTTRTTKAKLNRKA